MDNKAQKKKEQRDTNLKLLKGLSTARKITESMEFSTDSLNKQKYKLDHTVEKYGRLNNLNKTAKRLLKDLRKG